jgi:hypothetical protein
MQNILARKNLATLADFACSSVLLGFDYDGTLAPKASSPARASASQHASTSGPRGTVLPVRGDFRAHA